ncbi:MAG: HAD family hydrolase [Nodosilinea sp.]
MTLSTIFCDFDGPIVDVSDRYYATYEQVLRWVEGQCLAAGEAISIRRLTKSQFWTFKQNRVPDRQIAHWSGLEGKHIDAFLGRVSQMVNHPGLLGHDCIQPRAHEALTLLRQCQIRVVVVTLRCPGQVRRFLAQQNLAWAVSDLFGMDSLGAAYTNQANHKVERLQAATTAQRQQGYCLQQSYMVGDTEADIMAGQALGMDTVALTCGIRSSNYLQDFRPSYVMSDLWAVAQYLQREKLQRKTTLIGCPSRASQPNRLD